MTLFLSKLIQKKQRFRGFFFQGFIFYSLIFKFLVNILEAFFFYEATPLIFDFFFLLSKDYGKRF
jgi:hypothetical protein